ncbi:hypothetical protein EYF80_060378 [Liparis tanakae]|uniref:Uncharacterized protein n=1 Tax=Liparis tanakae TaxID=230148 RepID=A0A4Z2EKW5_9TELE|nr:hypothetical protein EYF80_060378 [Liparis tanakae]
MNLQAKRRMGPTVKMVENTSWIVPLLVNSITAPDATLSSLWRSRRLQREGSEARAASHYTVLQHRVGKRIHFVQ